MCWVSLLCALALGCDSVADGDVTFPRDRVTLACVRDVGRADVTTTDGEAVWLEYTQQARPPHMVMLEEDGTDMRIRWEWNLNTNPDSAAVRRAILRVEGILKAAKEQCGLDLRTVRCDPDANEQGACPWMRPL